MELAKLIWSILKPEKEFKYISQPSFEYDVQKRIPDVSKAKDILGFEAEVPLVDSVNEVINYLKDKRENNSFK